MEFMLELNITMSSTDISTNECTQGGPEKVV